ncbi:hypothetical protein EYF80_029729 [Liparis tanakae]|uniref:Uncharacterized protein n=1 Tax=Liparis tanakae TaxID=230148 RepID=A0A4Z2H3L1_9TELE|nr:hypothetical protein EYF80_029729 [Liparis tanakae]
MSTLTSSDGTGADQTDPRSTPLIPHMFTQRARSDKNAPFALVQHRDERAFDIPAPSPNLSPVSNNDLFIIRRFSSRSPVNTPPPPPPLYLKSTNETHFPRCRTDCAGGGRTVIISFVHHGITHH